MRDIAAHDHPAPTDRTVVASHRDASLAGCLASLARRVDGGDEVRENWWAERGSRRYINDEASLADAIAYVEDGQDHPRGQ